MNYHARILRVIENNPGCWNSLLIGVFDGVKQIGEYQRNYNRLYNTFYPFQVGEKWFALYSRDYTATRIMSLPDCKDIGGEEVSEGGFCPTGYYVPGFRWYEGKDYYHEFKLYDNEESYEGGISMYGPTLYEDFGFVCGCVWGDDNSFKVQFLDLKKAGEGIITRKDNLGYLELPERIGYNLKEAIQIYYESRPDESPWYLIDVTTRTRFNLYGGDKFEIKK